MKYAIKPEYLIEALREKLNTQRDLVNISTARIAERPGSLSTYASEMFMECARVSVIEDLIHRLECINARPDPKPMTDADLKEIYMERVLRGAGELGTSRSTSNTHNLWDDCVTRVWRDLYEGWSPIRFVFDAARKDPAVVANMRAEAEADAAERAAKAAALEEEKRVAKAAARKTRRDARGK